MSRALVVRTKNIKSAVVGNMEKQEPKKVESPELNRELYVTDLMLQMAALQKLLLKKGIITSEELKAEMDQLLNSAIEIVKNQDKK